MISRSIFQTQGLVLGMPRRGKTFRVAQYISECPHYCFFINTQFESSPKEYSEITVQSNVEVIQAIEQGKKKICIEYKMNWLNSDYYKNELDTLIMLIFSISEKNKEKFKATIIIDELDKYTSQHTCSTALDHLFNRGERFGLNAIGIAHTPQQIHNNIKSTIVWYMYFKLSEEALIYFKFKGRNLYNLKFTEQIIDGEIKPNYEGYYHEGNRLELFTRKDNISIPKTNNEPEMLRENLQQRSKMDNATNNVSKPDLDTNMS